MSSGSGLSPAKIIFRSPKGPEDSQDAAKFQGSGSPSGNDLSKNSSIELLTLKLEIEQDTNSRLNQIQQELHKQRLDSLRNLMQELNEDDWQYPDPEKLLGLK